MNKPKFKIMKKFRFLAAFVAAALALTSCNGDKLKRAEEQNRTLEGSLQETLATQDSLLVLINDITDGMTQIKELEKIITTPGNLTGDSESRRNQIRNDMVAIQNALQTRRQRLEELEQRLNEVNGSNSTLSKTVKLLKTQIAEQQTEISTLTNKLAAANIQIEELGSTVTNLTNSLDTMTMMANNEKAQRTEAEENARRLADELNECFYAIGTKSELKKAKIVESGFLRKTKVLKGEFDESYFTSDDMRTLTSIPLHSNKAKVLTNQPAGSYQIVDVDGQKVLNITDPAKFWQLTNILVIQVD